MKGKTCCVTGYRDLPQNEINKIKTALAHEIDAAVTDGFTCFMSGFADGVDQYFAELVLERKQTTPALELIAVIPYRKRLDSLNKKTRTRELLEACADVVVIQEKYLPSVYSHRNRYMVEQMFICPMTVPYSPEKSPKFLLVLDWKYRMDMRDISFPVPAWR
jgi:uncharacterized phage-like protein YoqJ